MSKITRRQFLKGAVIAGGAMALPLKWGVRNAHAFASSPQLQKWIQPLRGLTALGDPKGIPVMNGVADPFYTGATYYQVTIGEFIDYLHPALGPTRLWGYYDTTNPTLQRHLGGVILAQRGTPVRIRFTNKLPTPNIIPVDPTLPGANQAQNRVAIHLHGGFIPWVSDGGPFDWWDPNGASGLSFLNGPGGLFDNIPLQPMIKGQADYFYPNDQSARLMWYHDHAHGITRNNAYAGLATGYLIQDAIEAAYVSTKKIPGLASTIPLIFQDKTFVDPTTIVLTDPTWASAARPDVQSLGSLWYEHVYNPKDFRLKKSNKFLNPPVPTTAVPEFFGDTMLCNGTVYPLLTVEARRYRFPILNACNSRFLNINLLQADNTVDGITLNRKTLFPTNLPGPNMIQIGAECGFLYKEVTHISPKPFNPATFTGNLVLGCAERADIIIDFTGQAGKEFIMYNDAPGPFPAGPPTTDYFLGNPKNPIQPLPGTGPDTRQILRIKVVAGATDPQPAGPILTPELLDPKPLAPINTTAAPIPPLVPPAVAFVRDLTLNEDFDQFGRLRQLLGTTTPALIGKGFGLEYLAPATEVVKAGDTEIWRIFNLSADTHPIHFHLVNVQVLSRQPFKVVNGVFTPTGAARGPEPNELGWKETVQMHPGEVTSVIMKFELPAVPFTVPSSPRATAAGVDGMGPPATSGVTYHEYVWHCHILEHEEHDMMRPLVVKS